jgi:hypothetical protein
MPDKWRRCDSECLRCWRNQLKHGNSLKKKTLTKKQKILRNNYDVFGEHPKVKMLPWKNLIIGTEPEYNKWKYFIQDLNNKKIISIPH